MNKYISPLYRIIVPKPVRTILLKRSLRKKILQYFASLPASEINEDQREILKYLEVNQVSIFPYPFHEDYSPDKIEVFHDGNSGMNYVLYENKKLYFKKRWGAARIKRSYCELMREQDLNSPHRYLVNSFDLSPDDVVADIGAAEGNFSLSAVEKVKKLCIFEYDPEWIEALKVTFAPWSDKVEIIGKYVSDHNDHSHIKFDTFWKEHNDVNFLKIDVDGAETEVLRSCEEIFKSGVPMKIALCTYHMNEDEKKFTANLQNFGFTITPSKGYMINYYDKKMKVPYLRRGLIRAVRK